MTIDTSHVRMGVYECVIEKETNRFTVDRERKGKEGEVVFSNFETEGYER